MYGQQWWPRKRGAANTSYYNIKNLIITAFFRNQPFDSGSSAINRLARSARALASFASYADQLLSNTEIVNRGPERHSDLGKAETS